MFITAKFNSQCSETNKPIHKGEIIFWSKPTKQVFCTDSERFRNERLCELDSSMCQAQEDAYFDNFCHRNNI